MGGAFAKWGAVGNPRRGRRLSGAAQSVDKFQHKPRGSRAHSLKTVLRLGPQLAETMEALRGMVGRRALETNIDQITMPLARVVDCNRETSQGTLLQQGKHEKTAGASYEILVGSSNNPPNN